MKKTNAILSMQTFNHCDGCAFITSSASNLKRHKKTKHVVVQYPCDQCQFVTSRKYFLKKHKRSMHECIRYPCDQCEYLATEPGNLKKRGKTFGPSISL